MFGCLSVRSSATWKQATHCLTRAGEHPSAAGQRHGNSFGRFVRTAGPDRLLALSGAAATGAAVEGRWARTSRSKRSAVSGLTSESKEHVFTARGSFCFSG